MEWWYEKKLALLLTLSIVFTSACGSTKEVSGADTAESAGESNIEETTDNGLEDDFVIGNEEDPELEESNKDILSQAVTDDSKNIVKNSLYALTLFNSGKLQKAECTVKEDSIEVEVVAEDNKNYQILLASTGSLLGIKDLDTDSWVYTVTE